MYRWYFSSQTGGKIPLYVVSNKSCNASMVGKFEFSKTIFTYPIDSTDGMVLFGHNSSTVDASSCNLDVSFVPPPVNVVTVTTDATVTADTTATAVAVVAAVAAAAVATPAAAAAAIVDEAAAAVDAALPAALTAIDCRTCVLLSREGGEAKE